MKRWLASIILLFITVLFIRTGSVIAQTATTTDPLSITPPICGCPTDINNIYTEKNNGEKCVTDFATFQAAPATNHLWIEDENVTAQGKANDRARQFIFWVMTHSSIDNHPVLYKIWGTVRNLAYFFTILSAALLGLGIIVGQRTNFSTGIKVWPAFTKILIALLYISFSATIIISVIQLSEIFMKFFIENLGGKDLFNIYFSGISQESNYLDFVGCRDINIRVQEAVKTEMLVLKITNWSYYFMGGMLLLRKIVLWFLLFASPFLAILMFFTFIKNVGWIWIGVFFQWVFYGPLFALFLGSLATIWKAGVPFLFDFSRVNTVGGYVYPTAINILYGGPAQTLSATNNGNYVDTYVEYIITLIMLWAVTIFPWFLLRIFRDYCCDGINAIKNMLVGGLNSLHPGPTPPPQPVAPAQSNKFGSVLEMNKEMSSTVRTRIETVEEIKKAKTEEIVRSLDMKASKITDVAHFETSKTTRENVTKNINFIKNPTSASTPTERLKYMNIRSELSSRAAKADPIARSLIGSITYSKPQQAAQRESIIRTLPKPVTITNVASVKVKMSGEKLQTVSSSLMNAGSVNTKIVTDIAATTKISAEKVQSALNMLHDNINTPVPDIVPKISGGIKLEKEKVTMIMKEYSKRVSADTKIIEQIAKEQKVEVSEVKKVAEVQMPVIAEPEKNIEAVAPVSPTVSIDEYEEVKKMWRDHYEKGEIPVSENIKTRAAWVEQDIVLITNTLNKLLSEDKALKEQALDEVGYILPIFMLNSLSGEQLVTYLKAKVEAAKQVHELELKEEEITAKLKAKSEEEKVEVAMPKKQEAAKTMTMSEELKEPIND